MKRILIAGATGQLGTAIVEKLSRSDEYNLRLFVRPDSSYKELTHDNLEIAIGDLTDEESVFNAVTGCDVVISTANAVIPRFKKDTLESVDVLGHQYLIDAAIDVGVEHFIYTSALLGTGNQKPIPLEVAKLKTEQYLEGSGMNYTIFRPDAFMDISFAFMGTSLPLNNSKSPTIKRPFPFMQNFFRRIKNDINNGGFNIIGSGEVRHNYITVDNVADFICKSILNSDLYDQILPLGGPQSLSALDVKNVFEELIGKKLKVKRTPTFVIKLMGTILAPFNSAASQLIKLNHMGATVSSEVDCSQLAKELDIKLTTAREYLKRQMH